MKKFILLMSMAILSFGIITESWAECQNNTISCGENCCYTINNGNISFSRIDNNKTATIADYAFYAKNLVGHIIIPDWVTAIGASSFRDNSISELTLPDSITSIGSLAFHNNNLYSIKLPDSLNYTQWGGFAANSLKTVIISPNTPIAINFFGQQNQLNLLKEINIICKGGQEDCETFQEKLAKYIYWDQQEEKPVIFKLNNNMSIAGYAECTSTNYYWNGAECVREPDVTKRKCCSSCKDMGGYCNRIRYTPAEAAKVLNDDNTNSVTITFRK